MSRKENKKYFEILELSADASTLEIKSSYLRLRKLYSTNSIVISPIADEFSEKSRREILRQIDEAYAKLMVMLKDEQRKSKYHHKSLDSGSISKGEEKKEELKFSGQVLRQIRKKMGIHLYEVTLDTKIRIELLNEIELEKFDSLPHEAYLRGHISNYAKYLSLDPEKVADDYMERYCAWKGREKEEPE